MIVSIIVAKDKNNLIGVGLEMPWNLPSDFKYFKEKTLNHPIIMGRRTFESIGATPLPNRPHVIVTKDYNLSYKFKDVVVVNDIEDAILISRTFEDYDTSEVFICGGGEIYAHALWNDLVDKLYLTEVDTKIKVEEHDQDKCVYFPQISHDQWDMVDVKFHEADEKNKYLTFLEFEHL